MNMKTVIDRRKFYRDLTGVVSLKTITVWIKITKDIGSINLPSPSGRPPTARTKSSIT